MKSFWSIETEEILKEYNSSEATGLSNEGVQEKLKEFGKNTLDDKKKKGPVAVFINQFKSPISLILIFATILSIFLKDYTDAIIIFTIIFLSGILSFWQEYNAGNAVQELMNLVKVKTHVLRDGQEQELAVEEIVPGDIVLLGTGDIVPADGLILESKELNMDESTLTGETFPVEKEKSVVEEKTALSKRKNSVWMGTHVSSGSGKMVVVQSGKNTEFGKIYQSVKKKETPTEFEKGVNAFGFMLMKITTIIMIAIFVINIILKKPVFDSFMFSLALAVGLTPQLLPAIISINLSHGAKKMSEQKVIVKKLNAIENFGSMDVLCTDKTGTITEGKIALENIYDSRGQEDEEVLKAAFLNASLQSGFENPIDSAIKEYAGNKNQEIKSNYKKVDEKPYNFIDKRLSIAVDLGNETLFDHSKIIISKGAVSNMLEICTSMLDKDGKIVEMESHKDEIIREFQAFSEKGYRTLGIAVKSFEDSVEFDKDMIFVGFLTLQDPLKKSMPETIKKLKALDVQLKIITGDNVYVAKHIAEELGVPEESVLVGNEVEEASLQELSEKAKDIFLFAEIEPEQKEKVIEALRLSGDVVGYMGDGINDTPALQKADVSISVNTAADVAKDSASIVLLEEDLDVLVEGIMEGRKTFANTMKYVFMATSANFGNMFSMAGASLLLPFLPLLPKQVLLTNLLTDLPEMQIATDKVDENMVEEAHRWNISFIKKFMIVFGLISSIFDYVTFSVLYFIMRADANLFRTAWFVESVISASMIVLVLRTKDRFYKNRPGRNLTIATIITFIVTLFLPYSPLAEPLGFVPIPLKFLMILVGIIIAYIIVVEIGKYFFYKRVEE